MQINFAAEDFDTILTDADLAVEKLSGEWVVVYLCLRCALLMNMLS